jgi:hypothetical protein
MEYEELMKTIQPGEKTILKNVRNMIIIKYEPK